MKVGAVLAAVAGGLLLQLALARYMVGGHWPFDLVLVAVCYAALYWGPAAGILAGTIGGLGLDLVSGEVVGVGGLAKTLAGFTAGAVGGQFIVSRPFDRALVVGAATVVHRIIALTISSVIQQHWPGVSWAAMLEETAINAACGYFAFYMTDSLPGAIARGRSNRRSALSRRRW